MKITPSRIVNFLNEENFIKFKAILFYGENTGLIHKYITSISKKFLKNFLNKVTLNYINIIKNPDLLLNEINDLSFFGSKKIVVINEVSGVISSQLKQTLLNKQNPNVVIIFSGNQLSTKDQIRKFFELEKNLAIIPCYLEESYNIEKTIHKQFKAANIQVEHPDIFKYIANNIEGDSAQISTEIDKIISSCKEKNQITFQEIKNIITVSSKNANCDKYIASLISGKFQSAESELKKLILTDTKLHFIVKALSQYFVKLYLAHGLIAEGVSEIEVPNKLNPPIFFKNIPIFKLALKKYSISQIMKIIERLLKLEMRIKSHDTTTAKIILEQELLKIFYTRSAPASLI